MEYLEFERILSAKRMQRYKDAANGDTRKAMALYRYNLRLSQEMFTIVSCFEVALRNAIDSLLVPSLGENWLERFCSSQWNIHQRSHERDKKNHRKSIQSIG